MVFIIPERFGMVCFQWGIRFAAVAEVLGVGSSQVSSDGLVFRTDYVENLSAPAGELDR